MTADTLLDLSLSLPGIGMGSSPEVLAAYGTDQGPVVEYVNPLAVVWAQSVAEVQQILRWASRTGTAVVPRGAGTGVSGGAHATAGCIVLSLERMKLAGMLRPTPADCAAPNTG